LISNPTTPTIVPSNLVTFIIPNSLAIPTILLSQNASEH
jgi:hypothetical protein